MNVCILLAVLCQTPTDPTGFVAMLNHERAMRGLPAVAYDAAAAAVAVANNSHQLAMGLGHFVLGGYGQVAAIGVWDARSALAMWIGSPSHYAILFDPALASVGFDIRYGAATASTRQSFVQQPIQWYYPIQRRRW